MARYKRDDDFQWSAEKKSQSVAVVVLSLIYGVSLMHGIWSTYWACYVFHRILETLGGLLWGLALVIGCFGLRDIIDEKDF